MSGLLAAGLIISVGAGMLVWYYADALSRPAVSRTPARASLPDAAGAGMTLPIFTADASRRAPMPAASASGAQLAPTIALLRSSIEGQSAPGVSLPVIRLLGPPLSRSPGELPHGYGAPPLAPSRQPVPDRRLSGEVFAAEGSSTSSMVVTNGRPQMQASGRRGDALHALLSPDGLSVTQAQVLPTQRLLLPKGAFIDCTLETAIDSTLPGMTTCVTATDTFGADGTIVLLERGTKLIGETRGEVHQGAARVFVVWMEARTPSGVVVELDSPGTDALGRSGLEGTVDRHFWERFGAAALVSTIDGAVQSEVQSSSRGGTVVLDPTASEDVLTEILRSTVDIPPTIQVTNGARIEVLVARDVDFRSVYELVSR